jgi:hypothetical protein
MHCQVCLAESPSLLDMRGQFFIFNDQRMDLLSCFDYCKQNKIDNKQNAKICESCKPNLITEYISSKLVKSDDSITEQSIIKKVAIKEEPEQNFSSACVFKNETIVPKAEIKTESVLYQIIFPQHELKEEPELQISDEGVESDQDITGTG